MPGTPTPRSPPRWSSRSRRSATTSPPYSPNSARPPAPPPPQKPYGWACSARKGRERRAQHGESVPMCPDVPRPTVGDMPLYMDVHTIADGVALADVEQAHKADLQKQGEHDVNYLRYW